MSRKNRQRQQQRKGKPVQTPRVPTPTNLTTAEPTQLPTSWVRVKGVFVFLRNLPFLSVAAILISLFALWYTRQQTIATQDQARIAQEQTRLAQQTLDIATGKRQAKIQPADYFPQKKNFPESDIGTVGGTSRAYFRDANTLVRLAPAIIFNNDSDEMIDAVRVEVQFVGGISNIQQTRDELIHPPKDWFKNESPVILRAAHREETVLAQPWLPGEALRVILLKGVLDQISQVQSTTATDKLHHAELSIVVSARIAGGSVFSTTPPNPILMSVTWLPSGFPEGEVKRVQDSYIPYHISYKQKRTPTIPTTQSINPHRGSFNDLPRFDFPNGEKPK